MEPILLSRDAFGEYARKIASQVQPQKSALVLALHGDLGAGKTTFTQEVGKALGVTEDMASPTFVIQKKYPLENAPFAHLIHIDAYRLTEAEELRVLGWEDIVADSGNIIIIEWPENVDGLFVPDVCVQHIYFTYIDEDTRQISYGEEK